LRLKYCDKKLHARKTRESEVSMIAARKIACSRLIVRKESRKGKREEPAHVANNSDFFPPRNPADATWSKLSKISQ